MMRQAGAPRLPAAEREPIDVSMIGAFSPSVRNAGWPAFQRAAAAEGIRVLIFRSGTGSDPMSYNDFTDEFLRRFHVVVFTGAPGAGRADADRDRDRVHGRPGHAVRRCRPGPRSGPGGGAQDARDGA